MEFSILFIIGVGVGGGHMERWTGLWPAHQPGSSSATTAAVFGFRISPLLSISSRELQKLKNSSWIVRTCLCNGHLWGRTINKHLWWVWKASHWFLHFKRKSWALGAFSSLQSLQICQSQEQHCVQQCLFSGTCKGQPRCVMWALGSSLQTNVTVVSLSHRETYLKICGGFLKP